MTKNSGAALKEVFSGMVPLKGIEVRGNARKAFDEESMNELTENIRRNGVLVPVLLAKAGKDAYRLIAGERRLRAAKGAGLQEIPARVVEVDEARIEELQLFENLHRDGLGPIEEARAFKLLLEKGKYAIPGLAKQVDKSVKYVTRSIMLPELPEKAIKAIEKGVLTPEHGHQILRVPVEKRDKLVEYALSPKFGGVLPTIHELKREIESRMERGLSSACFPKDKEYAGEVACAACQFNTGNQDVLFEGAQSGKCTNSACFTKKTNHFLREFKEKAGKQHEGLKFTGYGRQDGASSVKGAAVLSQQESASEKVKALVKKNPEKFGFAVLKPNGFSGKQSPVAVIVCKDEELLTAAIRKVSESKNGQMTQEEREREEFLREAEAKALFVEAAAKLKAIAKKQLVDIVLALNGSEAAYKAMGIEESDDLKKTLGKLSENDLLKLAWLSTVSYWDADEAFTGLGVDVKKSRKETRKLAMAELEASKAAKEKEPATPEKKA